MSEHEVESLIILFLFLIKIQGNISILGVSGLGVE